MRYLYELTYQAMELVENIKFNNIAALGIVGRDHCFFTIHDALSFEIKDIPTTIITIRTNYSMRGTNLLSYKVFHLRSTFGEGCP